MATLGRMDDVAEMLEATGDFRCFRRVPPLEIGSLPEPPPTVRIGVVVDVEATGPDPRFDTPIEIAMVKFAYAEGRILSVLDTFEGQAEPPTPLSPEIEDLVGLTTADLAGKRFDVDALRLFVIEANVCLSHNAAYDRGILERCVPGFPLRNWACSLKDVPWKDEGVRDRRLGDLLAMNRLFADGHRAMVDCVSLVHLLGLPLPRSGRVAFEAMLEVAREPTAIFFAEKAPFSSSQALRERGYRWLDGRAGGPRCWMVEVPYSRAGAEATFLYEQVYGRRGARPSWVILEPMHRFRPIEVIAKSRVPAPSMDEAGIESGEVA